MNIYSLGNDFNKACFMILPMLGKHPNDIMRFRNCFVEDNQIVIMTRTGGVNREHYADGNMQLRKMPGFIRDEDVGYDSAYAFWYFAVPERWKADFDLILRCKAKLVSKEYRDRIREIYPELADAVDSTMEAN